MIGKAPLWTFEHPLRPNLAGCDGRLYLKEAGNEDVILAVHQARKHFRQITEWLVEHTCIRCGSIRSTTKLPIIGLDNAQMPTTAYQNLWSESRVTKVDITLMQQIVDAQQTF
jgi:hypothetical protein